MSVCTAELPSRIKEYTPHHRLQDVEVGTMHSTRFDRTECNSGNVPELVNELAAGRWVQDIGHVGKR